MIEEVYAMEGEKRKPGRPKSNLPTKVKRFSVRMSQPVYDRLREYANDHFSPERSKMAKASRKDSRGRVLRKGETQRKTDGRYVYSYTTSYGKRLVVYATTLEELRAKERQIAQDTAEGINTYVAGKATLNFVFDRYFESKKELRSTTASNYWYQVFGCDAVLPGTSVRQKVKPEHRG